MQVYVKAKFIFANLFEEDTKIPLRQIKDEVEITIERLAPEKTHGYPVGTKVRFARHKGLKRIVYGEISCRLP